MSSAAAETISDEVRARTLARFEDHRRAWAANEALRTLYTGWYRRVAEALPPRACGRFVELGSGPGFAAGLIPELELSDVVQAPWHAHRVSAETLPFEDGSLGALVLFDVLHHLRSPAAFFDEATRSLAKGGRVVMCEPFISPLSYPIYKFLHEEGADLTADPLAPAFRDDKEPFDGNQAVPTLLFARPAGRAAFTARFASLRVVTVERLAGPSYPASGGFGRAPLLPLPLWRLLAAVETRLPAAAFQVIGFRLLVVLERA